MRNSLKVERAKINVTQEELAQAVDVSRQTINSIETGKYVPSTILAIKIAQYFRTTVEQIFIIEPTD